MLKQIAKQLRSPIGLGLLVCLGLLVVLLSVNSWAILPAYAPYALLLLCPLTHLFMHRNMHNHNTHSKNSEVEEE